MLRCEATACLSCGRFGLGVAAMQTLACAPEKIMVGETNLDVLLRTMQAELQDGEFVFCSVNEERFRALEIEAICLFREPEGVTLILHKKEAETHALDYAYVSRMITLKVHSSLEAVGFLAAITAKLAAHGISVNAVSAYYHDHLFVTSKDAERTLELLQEFSQSLRD